MKRTMIITLELQETLDNLTSNVNNINVDTLGKIHEDLRGLSSKWLREPQSDYLNFAWPIIECLHFILNEAGYQCTQSFARDQRKAQDATPSNEEK